MSRKVYPTDVSDEEWEFVAPYLTLLREDAAQCVCLPRELFDAVRWSQSGASVAAVQQQVGRWRRAGCFEAMAHDSREVLRLLQDRNLHPTTAVFDGRILQSSPESGGRTSYDGDKRKNAAKYTSR